MKNTSLTASIPGQAIHIEQHHAGARLMKGVTPLSVTSSPVSVRSSFAGTLWLLATGGVVTLSNGDVLQPNECYARHYPSSVTLTATTPATANLHVIGIDTLTAIADSER